MARGPGKKPKSRIEALRKWMENAYYGGKYQADYSPNQYANVGAPTPNIPGIQDIGKYISDAYWQGVYQAQNSANQYAGVVDPYRQTKPPGYYNGGTGSQAPGFAYQAQPSPYQYQGVGAGYTTGIQYQPQQTAPPNQGYTPGFSYSLQPPPINPNAYDVRSQGQPGNVGGSASNTGYASTIEQIMKNYRINTDTGALQVIKYGDQIGVDANGNPVYSSAGGIDYGVTYENKRRMQASGGTDSGAMNNWGQPFGTKAPLLKQAQFGASPQRATGETQIPTVDGLQQSLDSITKNIQNFQYTGKQGSYTAARSGRRIKLMKRRKGILESAIKQLGGGQAGYGVQGASSGQLVNWSV